MLITKRINLRFTLLFMAIIAIFNTAYSQQLAFPGAEGYGKYTVGGRGGTVYEVTNLNDSGTGSLRAACEASGARTVVFKVSGTITLNSRIEIKNPNITIAGQTAPGDGITLRKYPILVSTNQVIIRYIRSRLGTESGVENDAFGGRYLKNIIIDHVSTSWSIDEVMSFYHCDNITVQWCALAESLVDAGHSSGVHGFGGICGSNYSSYHHNLIAHNSSRNLRIASGVGYFDYRNNVIYNWGYNNCYGGEAVQEGDDRAVKITHTTVNLVANYYKPGPATHKGEVSYRIANPGYRDVKTDYGKWYIAENVMVGNTNVTADNWNGGVQPDGGTGDKTLIKLTTPWAAMAINQQTAAAAYESVLDNGGCSSPKRDAIDVRIVSETRNGNATYEGPYYKTKWTTRLVSYTAMTGMIDKPSDVGGWPVLNSTPAPTDTDKDGMPNTWETAKGLNPNNASDRNTVAADGYTMLEKYLNSIEFNYPVDNYTITKLSNTSFKLTWRDNYLAEDGFIIERTYNGIDFTPIATLPMYTNNYTDNSASYTGYVAYRVVAYNTDNQSPRENIVSYGILPTGLNQNKAEKEQLIYYPNPVTKELNFDFKSNASQRTIEIFDTNGKLVKQELANGSTSKLDMSTLHPGVYLVTITDGDYKKVIRIVKQ